MARGTSDALFKKNTKLESYLKRTLPEEAFDRVRAYESCIIVSEKENKAFKYCVLDDEYIYLTENPPKNPQDIQAVVSLKDITSVEMVNDFPDFLSGEERDNTQHLRITHWTSVNAKRRSFRKPKKSPRSGSVSDLHGDRSNASTPLDFTESSNLSEDYGYITQSMSSLQVSRPESRGSISSSQGLKAGGREIKTGSIGKKKKRMSDSMEESVLKSLKEELEDGQLEDIEETDGTFSSSYLSMGLKSGRKTSTTSAKKETKSTRKKSEDTTSQTGNLGFASMSDYGGSVNGLSMLGVEGVSERRKVVLNIYLLNIHSPMLMLIRSAWSNYLIRCTLNIDTVSKSNVIRSGQIQRTPSQFLQLDQYGRGYGMD